MIANTFFSCENSLRQQMMRKEKGKTENDYFVLQSTIQKNKNKGKKPR